MQVSAEARWFWPGEPPRGFEKWFYNGEKHLCPFGGGELRLDTYLLDRGQGEIALKRRGGKKGVEIKGLVALSKERLHSDPFEGPIEIWTNWTNEALELPAESVIGAENRRWLRKFDTSGTSPEEIPLDALEQPIGKRPLPERRCNVELTQVSLLQDGRIWWTFGFEAFGSLESVEISLWVVSTALVLRRTPALGKALAASYLAWLREHAHK